MQTSSIDEIAFGPNLDLGVTSICRAVFGELVELGVQSFNPVADSRSWRRNYTKSFSGAVPLEFGEQSESSLERAIGAFTRLSRMPNGTPLRDSLQQAWESPALVELKLVAGEQQANAIALPDTDWVSDAERQVNWGLAEAALVTAAQELDRLEGKVSLPPLIAFAGGAELSAVPHWLRWGGEVLLLARTAGAELEKLQHLARQSSGRLWVVSERTTGSAGIDLVSRPDLAAAAIGQFVATNRGRRLLFGHFGYAPGLAHLRLEAVAQELTELLLLHVSPSELQFAWLATPTDSLAVPVEYARQRRRQWEERSSRQRIGEIPWRLFGYLASPTLREFEAADGEPLAVLDSAARLQGPSYSLAKRIQRWRAHTLRARGAQTSYQVTPPARTDSVLRHRILRATYRGASRFGLYPYDSYSASVWPAALFALDSLSNSGLAKKTHSLQTDWYFARAIHGGLWRTRYEASSVWVPATAIGLLLPKRDEQI